ncbi:MAG TPA: outer membrane beta-barrel protein [Hyphomicrobium sp.]|nr:outer membrane beta-barrel protein [Hyphomicrobium sp.]
MIVTPITATAARADILAPIWNGAYVGFHGGAKWADIDTDFSSSISANDITGGGHIGYNLSLAGVLVGIEADANLDSTKFGFSTSGGGVGSFETDWSGSIRGRIGIPVGPALLYATAGYAWTEATLNEASAAGGSFSSSHTFNGVVYGLGAEAFVLPNMSLRLEALRYDYAADDISISGAQNALQEFDPSETVVRAGVTFHLN